MAVWADWYPGMLVTLPGCPDPLLNQELLLAAQLFMRRTRCWMAWLEPTRILAGAMEYDLDTPDRALVVRVEKAAIDGSPIDVVSWRQIRTDPDLGETPHAGMASNNRTTFRLGREYPAGGLLSVQASLMPRRAATGIPDEFFSQHEDAIACGARARLMAMPGMTWTNFELAGVHAGAFDAAINAATVDAYRGYTNATPRRRVQWC